MGSITTEASALRAATFRITSTPRSQLPQQIPAISASLANCKTILSSAQASGPKSATETSAVLHGYRSSLATLIQDRTVHGRWAAIVLIKATVELGGWETLQKSLPWVRGLLGVLNRPDPPTSKRLAILTLTRIFVLTREYPTLAREITTPSLPTFIQSCLQLASSKAYRGLLAVILQSFNQLLPRHPTIFRTYVKQLQQIVGATAAPTPSSKLSKEQNTSCSAPVSSDVSEAARKLHVQLPCCAPKGASTEEWEASLKNTVSAVHLVADKVFRAVVEDWKSSAGAAPATNGASIENEVQTLELDALGLLPWSGIEAGSERLVQLLLLVRVHFTMPTTQAVNLRIAPAVDLLARIFSLTTPSSGQRGFQSTVKFNNQISKEEREKLWTILPNVHVAAFEVLHAVVERCGTLVSSLAPSHLDQLVWVFNSEKHVTQIRIACYRLLGELLKVSGSTLPKASIDPLAPLIRACCNDMLPQEQSSPVAGVPTAQNTASGVKAQPSSTNADAFLNPTKSVKTQEPEMPALKEAAQGLLPLLLTHLPTQHISDSLRTRIDRTAVLTQHKKAMVASVLNPPPSKRFGKPAASILPLMARSFSADLDVEGLLRPRLPVVRIGVRGGELDEEDEEEVDELDQVEEPDANSFIGEELDTLLESANQSQLVGDSRMAPAPVASASHSEEKDEVVALQEPGGSSNKRPQSEESSLSAAKRVKVDDEEQPVAQPATLPTAVPVPSQHQEELGQSAVPAIVPTLSTIPQPHNSGVPVDEDSDDDDDDDLGTLVIGQDTDDDSASD